MKFPTLRPVSDMHLNHVSMCLIFLSAITIDVFACDSSSKTQAETKYLCSCFNECFDTEPKCTWIAESLSTIVSKEVGNDVPSDIQVLWKQDLYLLEIVDYGWAGCFSTYGSYDSKYYRIDVEIKSDKPFNISQYKVEVINSIPSLEQRKTEIDTDKEDNTCLFRLP